MSELKPKALDLFCGAGGASAGLHAAGFDVVGVDKSPQPSYPFEFHQADALSYPLDGFDLVWASPPCQAFTAYRRRRDHVRPAENLIDPIRQRIAAASPRWSIIENVEGAWGQLVDPVMLCGSMFGLDVRRHRLFELSFDPGPVPACDHASQAPRFPQATNRKNLRRTVEVGVYRIPLEVQRKAMGIEWMSRKELSQAIPPAYAEWLARRALATRVDISVHYTNHRGERRLRWIEPLSVRYGTSDWHPSPGILIECIDIETGQQREFSTAFDSPEIALEVVGMALAAPHRGRVE